MTKDNNITKDTCRSYKKYRYMLAAGFMLLLIIFVLVFILVQQEQKADPASEALIRQEAAKLLYKNPHDMTDEDFSQIHSFTLGDNMYASIANPIALCDIKLLEKFTGLEWLCLGDIGYPGDKIPKWMIMLAKLGLYDLKKKFVLDLSPLRNLKNLRTLNIYNTPIKDTKPLSSLTNLRILFIVNSNISSIEPLKNSVNLQELLINKSEISDLRPLIGLKNLRRLNIKSCKNITNKQIEDLQKVLPDLLIQR